MTSPQDSTSTPPTALHSRANSLSPSSSESSIIDELSFDYDYDEEGNIVRNSRGSKSKVSPLSSFSSTPPKDLTGTDNSDLQPPKSLHPSPSLRRASLSRSESAYPVLNGPTTHSSDRDRAQPLSANPVRSFHRTASGPITTATESAGPPIRTIPRRMDPSAEARQKRNTEELRAKLASIGQEDKENIHDIPAVEDLYASRPAATSSSRALPIRSAYGSQSLGNVSRPLLEVPQRVLSSSSRMVLKGTGCKPQIDRISEAGSATESDGGEEAYATYSRGPVENIDTDTGRSLTSALVLPSSNYSVEDEGVPSYKSSRKQQQHVPHPPHSASIQPLNGSVSTRPRRSASLSDTLREFTTFLDILID